MKDFNLPFSIRDVCIAFLPFFLIGVLLFVNQQLFSVQKKIETLVLNPTPVKFVVAPYPVLQSSSAPLFAPSVISAQSAVVLDNDTQIVLFSKNPTTIFPMASTTKIMTALVALETYGLQDVLTVKTKVTEGAIVGFQKEERFYFKDLLYAMLLPSGNDAALTIAQNYPYGESEFIGKMNEKAAFLHLSNTYFSDVTGLSEENMTTALDLATLASYAMKNSIFSEIVGTKEKSITSVDGKVYIVANLNKLLGTEGVNGVKTGFTEEAGEVLATSRLINGKTITLVVMKSKNRFLDTQSLLFAVDKNIGYLEKGSLLKN